MSSFYSDASLVMIPSGYKTSKVYSAVPTDGTGDLTFTRSNDTATRVNSAGLIEKVRTNLVLQSNTFSNAAWINDNSTETSGQAGYDGTNDAWLLTASSAGGFIYQNVTIAGLVTFSIYAKAGSEIGITLYSAHVTQGRYFNLSTGALGGTFVGTPLDSKIESIGSGWYRCSITVSATATNNFRAYVSNGTANVTGNILIQAAQLESGDIMTDYIATTTAAVSVGPVANVPRLDYLNSSCPRLLLEPQRQNVFTFSESFDNAAWTKQDATITANSAVSPSGYQDADLYTTITDIFDFVRQTKAFTSGTSYTLSVFVKAGTSDEIGLTFQSAAFGVAGANFNLTTLAITTFGTTTGKIDNYGNGWYRCSATATATASANASVGFASIESGAVSTLYLWGAQLEAGAYATSYIPTLGAAVTRGADAAEKTGISSLIGSSEGTFFLEWEVTQADGGVYEVSLNDGTANNAVRLRQNSSNTMQLVVSSSGAVVASISSTTPIVVGQRYKLAGAYKLNDFVFYLNGSLVGSDSSGAVPLSMGSISTNRGDGNFPFYGELAQALLFKTRLSNADLAALTA